MSPGDGFCGSAELRFESIEDGDLIGEGLLNGPASGGVGRAGQSEAAGQHERAGGWIAYILRGIGAAWDYVTVAVKKENVVPVRRHIDLIGGAVVQRAGDRLGLGRSTSRKGENHYRCGKNRKSQMLGNAMHFKFLLDRISNRILAGLNNPTRTAF